MPLVQDFKFAVRGLRRDWLVGLVAVVSLAIALAGNTTVFSLVNAVLFRPLPYPEPERIVLVGEREVGAPQTLTVSPANLLDLAEANRTLGELAGFAPGPVAIGRDARPVAASGGRVSPAFFSILGAPVVRGRAFVAAEGEPGRDDVVMVSDEFLDVHMPSLEEPVGAEVFVDGRTRTIVGVLSAEFEFFLPDIQVWLPLALDPAAASRDERTLFAVGRLEPGVSMDQVHQDLQLIWDRLVLDHPDSNAGYLLDVANFRHDIPNAQARTLFALMQGAVLFVLLIACVNIANLMSARGHRRQREIALRLILGAGRRGILRQLLVESAILAAVAGAVGLAATYAAVRVIGARFAGAVAAPYLPAIDPTVLGFSLGATAMAALLFGLFPALQALGVDLAGTMKEGGRGVTGNVRRKMLSRSLVVAEIALSLILLAGAGMMVQGFLGLREADPGFDDTDLLTAPLTLPVEAPRERLDLVDEIRAEATALPGVVDVTVATALPLDAFAATAAFTVSGRPVVEGEARPSAFFATVDTGYLRTMRMPLVRGRFFDDRDRGDSTPVVVVNEALVRTHLPGLEAIGQRLSFRDREWEIVGIVGDTRQSLISTDIANPAAAPAVFVPLAQDTPAGVFLIARASTDPGALAAPLRQRLEPLHARLVLGQTRTLEQLVDQMWVGIDLINDVLRGFGFLSLLLAALGTYGVLAYNVAQRSQEIGVRLAVGARRGQVVGLVVRQGAWLGLVGLVAGAPVVFALVRVLQFALQGLGEVRVASVFPVAAVLFVTTVLASLFPALKAAAVQPVDVLRHD